MNGLYDLSLRVGHYAHSVILTGFLQFQLQSCPSWKGADRSLS